jgi:tetratricopeptide (TPR) repeat protein
LDSPHVYRYRPPLTAKRKLDIAIVLASAGLLSAALIGMALFGMYRPVPAIVGTAISFAIAGVIVHGLRGGFEYLRDPSEYRNGLRSLARGDRDAALKFADAAIARVPDAFSPWTLRGLLLADAGDFEGSLAAYRKAVERRPDSWIGHSGAGAALLNLGRLGEAVEELGRALALGASWPVPRYQLGLALFLRGEWAGAAEAFGEALALGLDAPNLQLVARTLRAFALERTGSHDAAREEKARAEPLRSMREIESFASRLRGANLSPVGKLAAWAVGVDASPEPPRL